MSLIVEVTITHRIRVTVPENDIDAAFDRANDEALSYMEENQLSQAEVETMEIVGSVTGYDTNEDAIYQERKENAVGIVA